MLSVAALVKAMHMTPPDVVTTSYVRDDPTANVDILASQIGSRIYYVNPRV